MKITMSRRDEVLRQKAEYDAEYDKQAVKYQNQYDTYREAKKKMYVGVENAVKDMIGQTSLNLDIRCKPNYMGGVRVDVSNGNDSHDDQALNWRWSVKLSDDGQVIKDSGSWSGLTAITPENIENLKESVRVLEILNNIDWNDVLNVQVPEYSEYVTERHPGERKSFNSELAEADIDDAIRAGLGIKGYGYKYYRSVAPVVYKVLSQTNKQYTVQEIYELNVGNESKYPDPYRVSKTKFMDLIKIPIETVEV